VPLQAVTLAVDELGASLDDIQAQQLRLRRIQDTSGAGTKPGVSTKTAADEDNDDAEHSSVVEMLGLAIAEARDVLLSQQEGCKGLQLIFDDVLEAQRIEQGRLRLRDEVVDVTRVLDSIVATFHRTAES